MQTYTNKDIVDYKFGFMSDPAKREAFTLALEMDSLLRERYELLSTDEDDELRALFDSVAADLAHRLTIEHARAHETVVEEPEPAVATPAGCLVWAFDSNAALPAGRLARNQLFVTPGGMVYVSEATKPLPFDSSAMRLPPMTYPCIEVDYDAQVVRVRVPFGLVPKHGRVDIVVVRLRKDEEPVRLPVLKGRPLRPAKEFGFDVIPFSELLPDGWKQGDAFVYAVRPAIGDNGKDLTSPEVTENGH